MKKIPILSNIFSRSRSGGAGDVVETDALPIDDPPGRGTSNSENISNNLSVNSSDLNAALQLQSQMDESRDLSVVRSSSNNEVVESSTGNVNSITNNQMAVHNTQGQVVMQFSHINGLHFGSVYNINSEKLEQSNTESVPTASGGTTRNRPRRTMTIEAMMRSSEELNHRMLDTISTHLGEGWKKVLRELGLTNGQIEQSIIDNQIHGGIKEVIYQLLLGWTQNAEDGTATLGIITQQLWKLDHRECVYQMRDVWKKERAARES